MVIIAANILRAIETFSGSARAADNFLSTAYNREVKRIQNVGVTQRTLQLIETWCRFILGLPIEGAMTAPIQRSIRGARDLGEQFEEDTNTQQSLQRARNASEVARTTILSGDVTLQQAEQLNQLAMNVFNFVRRNASRLLPLLPTDVRRRLMNRLNILMRRPVPQELNSNEDDIITWNELEKGNI